jgi:hypothetical protein
MSDPTPSPDDPRWRDAAYLQSVVAQLEALQDSYRQMIEYCDALTKHRDDMLTLAKKAGTDIRRLLPVLRRAAAAGFLGEDPADWWKQTPGDEL